MRKMNLVAAVALLVLAGVGAGVYTYYGQERSNPLPDRGKAEAVDLSQPLTRAYDREAGLTDMELRLSSYAAGVSADGGAGSADAKLNEMELNLPFTAEGPGAALLKQMEVVCLADAASAPSLKLHMDTAGLYVDQETGGGSRLVYLDTDRSTVMLYEAAPNQGVFFAFGEGALHLLSRLISQPTSELRVQSEDREFVTLTVKPSLNWPSAFDKLPAACRAAYIDVLE